MTIEIQVLHNGNVRILTLDTYVRRNGSILGTVRTFIACEYISLNYYHWDTDLA